ncbi:MAG: hypothetical protein U9N76_02030 [Candidatus Marinimicrobia bacterium]|nr:hypothetical protein [Candidatus Neomarinimicrobiota bacterium]
MPKGKTFGAKIANREKEENLCPVCGEVISHIKHYYSEKDNKDNVKYRSKMESICKCNKKEFFG